MTGPALWFIVPEAFDDPARVSGGNVYDRQVESELRELGWQVRTEPAAGGVDPYAPIPDGNLVLVDGLVAIRAPDRFLDAAARLRIVTLVHMVADAFADADPLLRHGERRALPRARRIIATSEWLRDELARRQLSTRKRIAVATPGAAHAAPAIGTPAGTSLLCVGVIAAHKGQDTLVDALALLGPDATWTCTIAGSPATDRAFAQRVKGRAVRAGLGGRITWTGVLGQAELDDAYAGADLLVAPSRTESYGIAVGEALTRGIPVIASDVGGIPEAAQPQDAAILVPPHDPRALESALRRWIADPALRARMSAAARRAAPRRRRWSDTAFAVAATLEAEP